MEETHNRGYVGIGSIGSGYNDANLRRIYTHAFGGDFPGEVEDPDAPPSGAPAPAPQPAPPPAAPPPRQIQRTAPPPTPAPAPAMPAAAPAPQPQQPMTVRSALPLKAVDIPGYGRGIYPEVNVPKILLKYPKAQVSDLNESDLAVLAARKPGG